MLNWTCSGQNWTVICHNEKKLFGKKLCGRQTSEFMHLGQSSKICGCIEFNNNLVATDLLFFAILCTFFYEYTPVNPFVVPEFTQLNYLFFL